LAKDFPKHKIIIKPHPANNIEHIKKKFNFKSQSNILVDNNFDLTSYIAGSDCVIYNESTAGIQSMVMGKKTICYKFKKNKTSLRDFANNCAPQAANYKTLVNYIKKKRL
jgi:surface carbohydrate biosynthesis protein